MNLEILLATNNQGKVDRYRKLAKQINPSIILHTLKDINIDTVEVEEDGNLKENAKKKAQAYSEKTNLPVLANDAGFFVEGEGLIKNPKRIALKSNENSLSKKQIYQSLVNYWQGIARKNGGKVDAAWIDEFALCMPDGNFYAQEARREVILTDKVFGKPHIQFPMRALYISKTTNKPAVGHTEEEELLEIAPIKDALAKLFEKIK